MNIHAILLATAFCGGAFLVSTRAPQPPLEDARIVVNRLSDESPWVRSEAVQQLRNRPDARPWLRRASRSTNKTTLKLASELLEDSEKQRQDDVKAAIDHAIKSRRIDMLVEWHQYWRPKNPDDLWSIAPSASQPGMDLHVKQLSTDQASPIVAAYAKTCASGRPRFYDFTSGFDRRRTEPGVWSVRASTFLDAWSGSDIAFAGVRGLLSGGFFTGTHHYVLGDIHANYYSKSFVCFEGEFHRGIQSGGKNKPVHLEQCVVIGRGKLTGIFGSESVILVDGDIDLSEPLAPRPSTIRRSLIRASGEIRLPKGDQLVDCVIEPHVKNPTSPYQFFEFAEVGLSLADDEEGLVVTGVKMNSPFGNSGLYKGDIIRAIDDVPAGYSEAFRLKLRHAVVRQGDCLVTASRGSTSVEVPIFFPVLK